MGGGGFVHFIFSFVLFPPLSNCEYKRMMLCSLMKKVFIFGVLSDDCMQSFKDRLTWSFFFFHNKGEKALIPIHTLLFRFCLTC